MAGLRVGLLVVLTEILLLVSVRGWEHVDNTQLQNLYGSAFRGESLRNTLTEVSKDYDDSDDEFLGEGGATSDGYFHSFMPHGFPVKGDDVDARHWPSGADDGLEVEFVDVPLRPRTKCVSSTRLDVVCTISGFQIKLVKGQLSDVVVVGSNELQPVMDAPESCGYAVNPLTNTLFVPFTGCNVKHTDKHTLQLLYSDECHLQQVATASCGRVMAFDSGLIPRPRAALPVTPSCDTPGTTPASAPPSKPQNCAVALTERVQCGQLGISSMACEVGGCCMDSSTSFCYYPLDECTVDQQFVFAIRYNAFSIPLDPTKLVIPGSTCKPVIVNDKVAIFKFKVTECGTRVYEIGVTKIYMAEVQTAVKTLDLMYGMITRADPLRFIIECRYSQKGNDQQLLVSTGYMVKTPTSILPSAIAATGLYAVDLRIATDKTYSSYFPTYHPALRLLLGNPVYLELNLKSPKPEAVLLVNYCLAYPLSAKNALVLIYEGCANPNDPNVSVLKVGDLPQNRHQRRFVVTAFQFMDQKTNNYLDEEIYFMCSTEVCRPTEKLCKDQCFDG